MKHNKFLTRWRMLFVATALATLGSVLVATTSFAQLSTGCRAYAEDYAERYSAGSAFGDAFRVGGRPSAASAMAASTARRLRKSTLINNAYTRCMQNRWP
jgi:hypothetical protein